MSIKQHCKGCKLLMKLNLKKYPSGWCARVGQRADKSIGHCKLNNLKEGGAA